jgi:RNA polymerase sigma-70 factor, ECF subfamily
MARNNWHPDETNFSRYEKQKKRRVVIPSSNERNFQGRLWRGTMQSDYALSSGPTQAWNAVQPAADDILIRNIACGDKSAMHVLYARHNVRVYRFIARLVGDGATAEDLTSDVFLDVWRNARFEGRSQVSTWMLAIAHYKALSHLRSRTTDCLDEGAAQALEDPTDDPAIVVEKKDTGALLRKCLAQLSLGQREVIDLVYYHERSMEQVACILQIPEPTVRTRMFYARKRLKELLSAQGVDHGGTA